MRLTLTILPLHQILQLADLIPGIGMEAITQRLGSDPSRTPGLITMENSTVFSFGPLGKWRVTVAGRWIDNGGGMCAEASFQTFSTRPIEFLGFNTEVGLGVNGEMVLKFDYAHLQIHLKFLVSFFQSLPEITVAIPEPLRSQGTWCTTYLDDDTRVSRQQNGSIFLFKKPSAVVSEATSRSSHSHHPPRESWPREVEQPAVPSGTKTSPPAYSRRPANVGAVPFPASTFAMMPKVSCAANVWGTYPSSTHNQQGSK